jgi:hypothetical protein
MNIEHMTDRSSTADRANEVTDMIEIQRALVADRIAGLERESMAIRAERERDHLREHELTGTEPFDHPADLPSRRVRLGRWLVAVGQAIAGPRPMTPARDGEPLSASFQPADGPGDDGRGDGRLAKAA